MKILLVKTSSGYVDVTKSTYNLQEIGLARAFNKKGHKCDVVYWGGKNEKTVEIKYDEKNSFNVFYLKAKDFLKNGIYGKKLIELSKNYDIVHSGGYDQIQSWIFASKIPEKLVIYNGTYYSDFNVNYNKKCKVFDKLFLPRYKKNNIFFDTKSNLSANFLQQRGLKNITSIGVGIDLEQLQAKKMIESDLSNLIQTDKEKGTKYITYIGRIEPRRNITFLIDLFYKVSKDIENVKLLLIGKGNKEYKDKCFDMIKSYDLEDKVLYKDYIKQELLPKIYNLSDVFLLPTRYEIFGMVLLEAMYFEAPVITTYNGGSDMLINHGENGFIIDNFNIDEWKNQIIDLVQNKQLSNKISKNARKKIEQEFTWDVLTDKFLDVFKNRLEGTKNE